MLKRTRFLLRIHPLIFLSLLFSNIKKNHFFPETESHTKLKLGLHMNSRLMHHVYLNRLLAFIYSFISSVFFLSNSKILNFWSHFPVRPTKLKFDAHMGKGLIYCVHQIQTARIYLFLYLSSFFSVSPIGKD